MTHLHRYSTRDGDRGWRTFWTLVDDPERRNELASLRFERYVASGARHAGISLETDDDAAGVQLFFGLPRVANAWLTIGSPRVAQRLYRRFDFHLPEVNVLTIRFHGGAAWWEVWHPKHSWTRGTPRWRHGHFNPVDALLGRPVHSEEDRGSYDVAVPLPEGSYLATVRLFRSTWKRPRWPWITAHVDRYDLEFTGARPGFPGKGENSWDCGEDGIHSQVAPGKTVEDAIGGVVTSVLTTRRRRGVPPDYQAEASR